MKMGVRGRVGGGDGWIGGMVGEMGFELESWGLVGESWLDEGFGLEREFEVGRGGWKRVVVERWSLVGEVEE